MKDESVLKAESRLFRYELLLHRIVDKLINDGREASLWFLNHQNENLQEHIFRRFSIVSEFVESEFWREVVKDNEPMIRCKVRFRSSECARCDNPRELQLTTHVVPLYEHSHNLVRIRVVFNREWQRNVQFIREIRPILFSVRLKTQRSCNINLRVLIEQQWTCPDEITQQGNCFLNNRLGPFDPVISLFAVS